MKRRGGGGGGGELNFFRIKEIRSFETNIEFSLRNFTLVSTFL